MSNFALVHNLTCLTRPGNLSRLLLELHYSIGITLGIASRLFKPQSPAASVWLYNIHSRAPHFLAAPQ